MKNSFLMSLEHKPIFDRLTTARKGLLIEAIYAYEATEVEPEFTDEVVEMAFLAIKSWLDKNREAYEEKCATNRENGKLGGRPKKEPNGSNENPKKPNGLSENREKAKKPEYEYEYDSDNDSKEKDIPNGISKKKKPSRSSSKRLKEMFDEFWEVCPRKVDKKKAWEEFKKLDPDEELFKKILAGMKAYRDMCVAERREPRNIKHPSGWLKDARWEDDYTTNLPPPKEGTHYGKGPPKSGVRPFAQQGRTYREDQEPMDLSEIFEV